MIYISSNNDNYKQILDILYDNCAYKIAGINYEKKYCSK